MKGFRAVAAVLLVFGLPTATAAATYAAGSDDDGSGNRRITLTDDCDPRDPAWNAIPGGCARKRGTVSVAEFDAELDSPLAAAVVGHQSWRVDPSYVAIKQGQTVRVRNTGGRPHTFTRVANFGGGVVPPHNEGLIVAPECPPAAGNPILPGQRRTVSGLTLGTHRFQCCFHPWQRAHIEVQARGGGGGGDDD
jgi:hypothetical protein